jgi:hypothetical protein
MGLMAGLLWQQPPRQLPSPNARPKQVQGREGTRLLQAQLDSASLRVLQQQHNPSSSSSSSSSSPGQGSSSASSSPASRRSSQDKAQQE